MSGGIPRINLTPDMLEVYANLRRALYDQIQAERSTAATEEQLARWRAIAAGREPMPDILCDVLGHEGSRS